MAAKWIVRKKEAGRAFLERNVIFSETGEFPEAKEKSNEDGNVITSIWPLEVSLEGDTINKETVTIGRTYKMPADIKVETKSVSRVPHATIVFRDGTFFIRDEGSTNGTIMAKRENLTPGEEKDPDNNKRAIKAKAAKLAPKTPSVIRSGDIVRFGGARFMKFVIAAALRN